ncbi:MBL fold metallo-hydrolase [Elusimicrobiota bacterium]
MLIEKAKLPAELCCSEEWPGSMDRVSVKVLGSSSYGNCTVMWTDCSTLMIDCGFSYKYISGHLAEIGKDLSSVDAILITHIHSDHVNPVILKKADELGIPVYCHKYMLSYLYSKYNLEKHIPETGIIKQFYRKEFRVGEYFVRAFDVWHDSDGGCSGFNIYLKDKQGVKISIATDLGDYGEGVIDKFQDSDIIIIESNHDIDMLSISNRPVWVKKRIADTHLSNSKCSILIKEVVSRSKIKPRAIILAHISKDCNTEEKAKKMTRNALKNFNLSRTSVICSKRREPIVTITVNN